MAHPTTSSTDLTQGTSLPEQPVSSEAYLPEMIVPLYRAFGVEFHLLDGVSGNLLSTSSMQPKLEGTMLPELCRQVAQKDRPEIIAEEHPLAVLAVPLSDDERDSHFVAVGMFVTKENVPTRRVHAAATCLGFEPDRVVEWVSKQKSWSIEIVIHIAGLILERVRDAKRLKVASEEAGSLSLALTSTYEEITLLYRLIQKLKLSESNENLGLITLEWLSDVLPAEGFAIQFLPVRSGTAPADAVRVQSELITHGQCPVDNDRFTQLAAHLNLSNIAEPAIFNHRATEKPDWPFPKIREMTCVPLAEGDCTFGWLAAFNHVDGEEFGTSEASLLSSIGTILGIHGRNIELYRDQAELLSGVVRALTSAIDAKDPYTRGHSDRVAQSAVRLARQMGYDSNELHTVYLAGLLHDVGKIGINDNVLCKPGTLTNDEFEHIKTHVNVGHRILQDLQKLDDVLPGVLHHHESWDGKGYPHRLPGEQIPLLARIVAVADAFDAMGSDRPYREKLPDEKIDEIFHSGSGQQWDPAVVEAFFIVRDDLREIMREQRDQVENAC